MICFFKMSNQSVCGSCEECKPHGLNHAVAMLIRVFKNILSFASSVGNRLAVSVYKASLHDILLCQNEGYYTTTPLQRGCSRLVQEMQYFV